MFNWRSKKKLKGKKKRYRKMFYHNLYVAVLCSLSFVLFARKREEIIVIKMKREEQTFSNARDTQTQKRININKFIRCEWCGDRIDWRSNVLLLLPVVRYISQLKMFLLMWCAREWSTHTQLSNPMRMTEREGKSEREMIPSMNEQQTKTNRSKPPDKMQEILWVWVCVCFRCVAIAIAVCRLSMVSFFCYGFHSFSLFSNS